MHCWVPVDPHERKWSEAMGGHQGFPFSYSAKDTYAGLHSIFPTCKWHCSSTVGSLRTAIILDSTTSAPRKSIRHQSWLTGIQCFSWLSQRGEGQTFQASNVNLWVESSDSTDLGKSITSNSLLHKCQNLSGVNWGSHTATNQGQSHSLPPLPALIHANTL